MYRIGFPKKHQTKTRKEKKMEFARKQTILLKSMFKVNGMKMMIKCQSQKIPFQIHSEVDVEHWFESEEIGIFFP